MILLLLLYYVPTDTQQGMVTSYNTDQRNVPHDCSQQPENEKVFEESPSIICGHFKAGPTPTIGQQRLCLETRGGGNSNNNQ